LVLSASLLPLLAPLRGFLQARRSSYIWLGLLSQLYFIHGVGAFTDSAERILASLEITASLVLFTGSWAELRPKESS
jgi:uncharacterized membrane protein